MQILLKPTNLGRPHNARRATQGAEFQTKAICACKAEVSSRVRSLSVATEEAARDTRTARQLLVMGSTNSAASKEQLLKKCRFVWDTVHICSSLEVFTNDLKCVFGHVVLRIGTQHSKFRATVIPSYPPPKTHSEDVKGWKVIAAISFLSQAAEYWIGR